MPITTLASARPSGSTMPEGSPHPFQEREHLLEEAPTLIRAVEDLLARRNPPPSRFWPGDGSAGDNDSFELVRWESRELRLLSRRGGQYIESTDAAITAKDADFPRLAVLEAIEEVLLLARRLLDSQDPPSDYIPVHNVYLLDDIRATFRRQLTALLADWYRLEAAV